MTAFRTQIPAVARYLLPAGVLLLGACATEPEPDNIRFGEAVQHMIYLQTTDANASTTPSLDGVKADNALLKYRSATVSPQTAGAPSPGG